MLPSVTLMSSGRTGRQKAGCSHRSLNDRDKWQADTVARFDALVALNALDDPKDGRRRQAGGILLQCSCGRAIDRLHVHRYLLEGPAVTSIWGLNDGCPEITGVIRRDRRTGAELDSPRAHRTPVLRWQGQADDRPTSWTQRGTASAHAGGTTNPATGS